MMGSKMFSIAVVLVIAMVFLSGCVSPPEGPASGNGDNEQIETQEDASEAVTEIGTAMNSLIAELEGIDAEIE